MVTKPKAPPPSSAPADPTIIASSEEAATTEVWIFFNCFSEFLLKLWDELFK